MMENPKCPYCGGEMEYQDQWIHPFYICLDCYSQSPKTMEIKSQEEAYAAAMKRDRAKGEWITDYCAVNGHSDIYCSVCNKDATYFVGSSDGIHWSEEYPAYCPNCGADMRKEDA